MHPALRQYVGPPQVRTGRYIAVGALTTFAGILLAFSIVQLVEARSRAVHARDIETTDDRDAEIAHSLVIATRTTNDYAFRAFPSWVVSHPDEACPRHLSELSIYLHGEALFDPWGIAYRFHCDGTHFTVISAGPDRVYDTTDDIRGGR